MGGSVGFSARVGQPSTFLIVIWPEASSAQNSMAAVSAEGRTVWVLIRRLNSSCRRSTAFVVRADFHWLGGRRVKVKSLSPASSRLSATARHLSRHLRRNAFRLVRVSASSTVTATAERRRGLQIDRKAEARRLLKRQVRRLRSFENAVNQGCHTLEALLLIWPIGHQATVTNEEIELVDGW